MNSTHSLIIINVHHFDVRRRTQLALVLLLHVVVLLLFLISWLRHTSRGIVEPLLLIDFLADLLLFLFLCRLVLRLLRRCMLINVVFDLLVVVLFVLQLQSCCLCV